MKQVTVNKKEFESREFYTLFKENYDKIKEKYLNYSYYFQFHPDEKKEME